MSSYINEHQGITPDFADSPPCLTAFIQYLDSQKARSINTINSYYLDIRMFMRFLLKDKGLAEQTEQFSDLSTADFPEYLLLTATASDIKNFMFFCSMTLKNSSRSRSRKLTSLKRFYAFLLSEGFIASNPAKDIEGPDRHEESPPRHLSYDECIQLLSTVDSEAPARDRCILIVLLNSGIRLSELIGINFDDYNPNNKTVMVHGKGNKNRVAYLNDSCVSAIAEYLQERSTYRGIIDGEAMFVSKRTGKRLTRRGVEHMVKVRLKAAGLGNMKYSPHKFRHTAATLLYNSGTELLVLKNVLGHQSTSTTEIYTHIDVEKIASAVESSPLSKL